MATQQDIIKKFMYSLDNTNKSGQAALNEAIDYATKDMKKHFSTASEVIEQMIEDCNSNGRDKFLKNYCGINLDNDDTGAITGSDAGGAKIKTAKSIVPESGNLDENFTGTSFTVPGGMTVHLAKFPNYDDTGELDIDNSIDYEKDLNDSEKYIWQAFKTWWAEGALNLIAESYGENYGSGSRTLYFGFIEQGSSKGYQTGLSDYRNGLIRMAINSRAYSALKNDGNPDGESSNVSIYLDRTIAHEMTHAVMYTNVSCNNSLPQFIKEGVAELTIGVDDKRKDEIKELAGDSTSLKEALSLTDTGTNYIPSYAAGYMFFRYLAKQAADGISENSTSNSVVSGSKGNDSIKNFGSNVTMNGGNGADYLFNHQGSNVKMYGGAGNDTLNNYIGNNVLADAGSGDDFFNSFKGSNVTVNGGAGNDTLHNTQGTNVTMNGGTGDDAFINSGSDVVFVYKSGDGNDLITGFNETSTLQFAGSTNASLKTSGKNVIATVGKGKVTLTGAASLSVVNVQGSGSGDYIKTTVSGAKIEALGGNDFLSCSGSNVTLNGGKGNDTLKGGKGADYLIGGKGNDSLWGGKGNDTLYGGAGKDIFIFKANAGTDTIFDFESGDILKILNTDGSQGKFKSSKYSGGDLTLKINGGGKIIFDDISSSTQFNINGTTYKISGSKLK